jgi:hypothetical protein
MGKLSGVGWLTGSLSQIPESGPWGTLNLMGKDLDGEPILNRRIERWAWKYGWA